MRAQAVVCLCSVPRVNCASVLSREPCLSRFTWLIPAGVLAEAHRALGAMFVLLVQPWLKERFGQPQLPDNPLAGHTLALEELLHLLLGIFPGQALLVATLQVLKRAFTVQFGNGHGRILVQEAPGHQVFARHRMPLSAWLMMRTRQQGSRRSARRSRD